MEIIAKLLGLVDPDAGQLFGNGHQLNYYALAHASCLPPNNMVMVCLGLCEGMCHLTLAKSKLSVLLYF